MRLLAGLSVVALLVGCAQLKSGGSSSGGGGGGERNDVGKPSTPDAKGYMDMPFLTSLSEEDARETLAESQVTGEIKVEKTECYDKKIPSGHVCNTLPGGGEKTWVTSTVVLYVVP